MRRLQELNRTSSIVLTTDPQYVFKGIIGWIKSWKNVGRQSVKNRDLWERLDELHEAHKIDWRWVKSHSSHLGNERADALANRGIDELGEGRCDK